MEIRAYYNKPEIMAREPRKRMFMTIAGSLKLYLKYLLEELDVESYAMSYLVEDLIFFVVSNQDRLRTFIEDTYELDEGETIDVLPPPPEIVEKINSLIALSYAQSKEDRKEDMGDGKIKNK